MRKLFDWTAVGILLLFTFCLFIGLTASMVMDIGIGKTAVAWLSICIFVWATQRVFGMMR